MRNMLPVMARVGAIALFSVPLYCLARWFYLRQKAVSQPNKARKIWLLLFVIYLVALLSLVWQPGSLYYGSEFIPQSMAERLATGRDINFVPFAFVSFFASGRAHAVFTANLAANVLLFVPLGILPPLLWGWFRRCHIAVACGMAFSLIIEFVQLFIGRSVDIDDVLLNTAGVAIGFALWKIFATKNLPKGPAVQ